jgi:2-dehydropantoate 2-reductase
MPVSPVLRIAVIGAGSIGSAFAFQFASAGHQVAVVARPGSDRLRQLQEANAIVNVRGERAAVVVGAHLDETVPYDLVLVTVLAHQVDVLVPALQRSAAGHILFVFNNFEPERLRALVGPARCGFGMPFLQARLDRAGVLTAVIGAGGQKSRLDDGRWVTLFNAVGLPAVLEPAMPLWLRCHVPLCVALESVAVIAARRGAGASWTDAAALARGMRQGFDLVKELGDPVYPRWKAGLAGSPHWVGAALLWSLSRVTSFRALLSGAAAECRALVDVMVAAGAAAGKPVAVDGISAMKPGGDVHQPPAD